MSGRPEDRRRDARVGFDAPAWLAVEGRRTPVGVIDLSVRGALVRPAGPLPPVGAVGELRIGLGQPAASGTAQAAAGAGAEALPPVDAPAPDEAAPTIRMAVEVRHVEDGQLGLACTGLDLDSATHLRRLVALNLGDEALAERSLKALGGA